ncbi:serine/threonine-protein kinase [Nocardia neocaledoniensis]|uniref:serine/threonine-protein kinase n=1 Tax=Nocardia neocaledoniensis TaxID=236511 RepID=UPI002454E4B8|nr:serine/threonine-protein kinase [Nocardia neocaledoniensis]
MLATGDVFAGYAIERQLGRGGMGSVYLARHPRLPRQIALKLLNAELFSDNEIRARFEREADLAARLEHPNIVTVYDRGVDDGRLWISMQFVDGVDAAAIDHPVPAQRAMRIIEGTAAALDHAHGNGVLHRDVKPANILLTDIDGTERVLLTDFGIARPRDDVHHLTQTGTFTATLAYASPEQLTGAHLDHRSDQYSLACTLYSLLTGVAPFEATNPAVVIQGHLQSPPPSLRSHRPDLPAALDGVLARALAKRPADRFHSCAEFAAAARRALSATGAQPTVVAGPSSNPHVPVPNPFGQVRPPGFAAPQPYPAVAPRNSPSPYGVPMRPYPPRAVAPRRRGHTGVWAVLALVVALVAGGGAWVWQDETSFVSVILGRSQGHQDLNAMASAFPGMLPDSDKGTDGHFGTSCRAAPQWQSFYSEDGPEKAFDGWRARWECLDAEGDGFAYRFYSFDSEATAEKVVGTFAAAAQGRGVSTYGPRQDHRFVYTSAHGSVTSTVISRFTDGGDRGRFLLFVIPRFLGEQILDELAQQVAAAPW